MKKCKEPHEIMQGASWEKQGAPWENARSPMGKRKKPHGKTQEAPWKKTRSPSLAFAMEGLSEEGGDLLSRIAVQYHRRAWA